jgi:alkylation response protein AidB-like acyl-CoA dehydrogenase
LHVNLKLDPEDHDFRGEVRDFLRAHLPADVARRGRYDFHHHRADIALWTAILAERGWSVPHWPLAYGGTDWTPMQRYIFEEEMRLGFAPTGDRIGTELVAPVIYTFGSEDQRQEHLPAIRNGECLWAQGFSEPGSGSDLSSLRTRAVRDGDYYIVSGHKTWTTDAHHSDKIFTLVRTNLTVKPQAGISALLINLDAPGITRRPIWTIDEGLTVNEIFFDDVRVPARNLVGEEGAGWTYAKFLLNNERATSAEVPHTKRDIAQLRDIAAIEQRNGRPLLDDPIFSVRLARIEVETLALEYAVLRVLTSSGDNNPVASLLKVRGSELRQQIAILAADAIGDRALAVSTDREADHILIDEPPSPVVADYAVGLSAKAIFRRATTIYGGSNEIQRALIAKTIMKL